VSALSSIAIKCCDLEAQRGFYEALTGSEFQEVDVGVPGMRCLFGQGWGLTLKLVSGREGQDFEGYPIHQLGLRVDDIEALVKAAELAGGRAEGELARDEGGQVVAGCVRDPDGNTIELQRA
jgi:catechol 2,3-dioxygenase-like lactoylglutathione lyase family enzyme